MCLCPMFRCWGAQAPRQGASPPGQMVQATGCPHTGPLGKSPSSGIRGVHHMHGCWQLGGWGGTLGRLEGVQTWMVWEHVSDRQVHSRVTDRPYGIR